jgi:hypothetical protein
MTCFPFSLPKYGVPQDGIRGFSLPSPWTRFPGPKAISHFMIHQTASETPEVASKRGRAYKAKARAGEGEAGGIKR